MRAREPSGRVSRLRGPPHPMRAVPGHAPLLLCDLAGDVAGRGGDFEDEGLPGSDEGQAGEAGRPHGRRGPCCQPGQQAGPLQQAVPRPRSAGRSQARAPALTVSGACCPRPRRFRWRLPAVSWAVVSVHPTGPAIQLRTSTLLRASSRRPPPRSASPGATPSATRAGSPLWPPSPAPRTASTSTMCSSRHGEVGHHQARSRVLLSGDRDGRRESLSSPHANRQVGVGALALEREGDLE